MPEIITRSEAKARGLNRYFTGAACPHGHITVRVVSSGACLACKKDRALCKERRPYELKFPDPYFQACYRRAIGGCKERYIEYTNKNWLQKWSRMLESAQEEVGALQRLINGFRRDLNDRSSRHFERYQGNP